VGDRWEINSEEDLAALVALVAKAQAIHAENILSGTVSGAIVFEPGIEEEIRKSAIEALTVPKDLHGVELRGTKKWHRDGVLFESISWIVARKCHPDAVMRDPHN